MVLINEAQHPSWRGNQAKNAACFSWYLFISTHWDPFTFTRNPTLQKNARMPRGCPIFDKTEEFWRKDYRISKKSCNSETVIHTDSSKSWLIQKKNSDVLSDMGSRILENSLARVVGNQDQWKVIKTLAAIFMAASAIDITNAFLPKISLLCDIRTQRFVSDL